MIGALLFIGCLIAAFFLFTLSWMNLRIAVRHYGHGYTQAADFCIKLSLVEIFASSCFVLFATIV